MDYRFPICENRPKVPTEEEEAILKRLRALKEEIRAIKESLRSASDQEQIKSLSHQLEILRNVWDRLQAEKEKARENRMRLLGYY